MKLTHKEAVNRERDIQDELERLKNKKDKTPEDMAAVQPLLDEFREVHTHRLDLEHDAALAEVRGAMDSGASTATADDDAARRDGRATGDVDVVDRTRMGSPSLGGKFRDPWDLTEMRWGADRPTEMRARARDAAERMPWASDTVREVITKLVERDADHTPVSDLVLATTSPEYSSAFIKLIRSKGQATTLLPPEAQALQRAMSLTDSAGGFLVPAQLDPTVIITANGSVNQIRQISRVVNATSDVWKGVTSAGVTGSWDSEAQEVSDDAPTLAQPEIPIHKLQIFVPLSHEVQMDAAGIANDIAEMIAFEKDAKEGIAFAVGTGSGQPTGIVTALTGTSSVVATATADTFAVGDVYELDSALPQRFAANASWLGHRRVYNMMRRFDTNGGASLWGFLAEGRKQELLGRPDYVSEAMKSSITPSASNPLLVYGDFRNYVVADRLGITMSYIPHLFGPNGRPTGQAGWHAWLRVGADSVNDAAFRMLDA